MCPFCGLFQQPRQEGVGGVLFKAGEDERGGVSCVIPSTGHTCPYGIIPPLQRARQPGSRDSSAPQFPAIAVSGEEDNAGIITEPIASLADTEFLKISINSDKFTGFFDKLTGFFRVFSANETGGKISLAGRRILHPGSITSIANAGKCAPGKQQKRSGCLVYPFVLISIKRFFKAGRKPPAPMISRSASGSGSDSQRTPRLRFSTSPVSKLTRSSSPSSTNAPMSLKKGA